MLSGADSDMTERMKMTWILKSSRTFTIYMPTLNLYFREGIPYEMTLGAPTIGQVNLSNKSPGEEDIYLK